jgi:hypothetical protein
MADVPDGVATAWSNVGSGLETGRGGSGSRAVNGSPLKIFRGGEKAVGGA